MPSFVIHHAVGFPDEIEADRYERRDGDLIFFLDGEEVFRLDEADALSIEPRDRSPRSPRRPR
jgi:hypothetical protein